MVAHLDVDDDVLNDARLFQNCTAVNIVLDCQFDLYPCKRTVAESQPRASLKSAGRVNLCRACTLTFGVRLRPDELCVNKLELREAL